MSYKYIVEVKAQSGQLAALVAKFNSDILPAMQAHALYVDAEVLLDTSNEVAVVAMVTASPCPGALEFTAQQLNKAADLIMESKPVRGLQPHALGDPLGGSAAD
jgi:hypothetical protein